MYSEYQTFVNTITNKELQNFKTNTKYNSILEHVSKVQGTKYIQIIENMIKEIFIEITFENINEYLILNDKFGNPNKYLFKIFNNDIFCSPTSLRYICHSFIILKYFKTSNLKKIVEIGCGYGGLFLAINHFSNILNIKIQDYYIIDLPEICNLIELYLNYHSDTINIKYHIHKSYNYGKDIKDNELFLISNYCFTEISDEYRDSYISNLFSKIKNGFIIWQTIFNLQLNKVSILKKDIISIEEEYPQTATNLHKNYYVYF